MDTKELVDEIIKRFDKAGGSTAVQTGVIFKMEGGIKPTVYVKMEDNTYSIPEHTIGDEKGDENVVEVLRWIRGN